jgi:hypothetical protein
MDLREMERGKEWIGLSWDKDRWRDLVNGVIKFLVP